MKLILAYKRRKALVDDTHLFDGYLQEDSVRLKLEGKTFAELIFKLSERLRGLVLTPHDEVAMIRLEQPSVVHAMDDNQVEMIRTHPHKYIEAMSPPPRRIVLKVSDRVPVGEVVATSIRAGIETLIDAFGELVYAKMKVGGGTECPVCGRWKAATYKQEETFTTRCTSCDFVGVPPSHFITSDGGWVAFYVEDLLSVDAEKRPKFFLPRLWNTSGPWITREDLQARYDKYLEEKENADR
jgi:hypothetical protein